MLIFKCFLVQVGDFYFFTALANKPPLKGEGDQRSWWRGFLWNLLLDVLGFTEAPLSQACGLPAPLSGEPITNKPPLKGEGDRR